MRITARIVKDGATMRLKGIGSRARDMTPIMRAIAQSMLWSVQRNFQVGGRRDGAVGAWRPLAASTIARRKQANPKILLDTRALYRGLRPASGPRFARVVASALYAEKHNQGGRWGHSIMVNETLKIPAHTRRMHGKRVAVRAHTQHQHFRLHARPFLVVQKQERVRYQRQIRAYVLAGVAKRGAA